MVVEIRLFATFRKDRFKKKKLDIPGGCSLADLLERLEIPQEQVGIILVNGRNAAMKSALSEHDVVSIFPLMGGG